MDDAMNIVIAFLIVVAATAVAVAVMLVARRRAPDGGYFADGDRAAGIFGVLATGFSVLLGFLIFLGLRELRRFPVGSGDRGVDRRSTDPDRPGPPGGVGGELTGELVCYARFVIHGEWDRMEAGTLGEDINPWGAAMFRTLQGVELSSPVEETAYGKWLDQTSTREEARQDRIHGAVGVMPTPLWIALFVISGDRAGVHVRVRRQRRASLGAGDVRRQRGRGHRHHAASVGFLDEPVPWRYRRACSRWRWNAPSYSSISNWP